MDQQQVIAAVKELVHVGGSFVFATVDAEGFPRMRWMGGCFFEEPMTIYMAAAASSRKMAQLANHPKAQLLFQTADYSRVATLTGVASEVVCAETKRKVFAGLPGAGSYFSGPDDAQFGVIRFDCARVEMLGLTEGMEPVAAEV